MLFFCLIFSVQGGKETHHNKGMINCDIQKGPCNQTIRDIGVTLDVQPKPVAAMKNLTFQVTLNNYSDPQVPFIDLGMPGMNMGRNRVTLDKTNPGTYRGTGVIVRCPSGSTTWRATVTIPQTGKAYFVFDVIY